MNYSENDAIKVIDDYFVMMNEWELKVINLYKVENGGPQKNQEKMRDELRLIHDRFLTKKERKTGRVATMVVSLGDPVYDLKKETVVKVEEVPSGFFVYTKKEYVEDDYSEDYRYNLKSTKEGLLIDHKERYSDYEDKWVKDVL